jgi:putative ABC transport system permease protein
MNEPSRLLRWLLNMICPESRQDLNGDFLELYALRRGQSGKINAELALLGDIITAIPFNWIVKTEKPLTPKSMLGTNLKIARRTLVRNRVYSLINIFGLSASFAACLLISIFVFDELAYDQHIELKENVFRISGNYNGGDINRTGSANTTYMLLPIIESKLSAVEATTRVDFMNVTIGLNNGDQVQQDAVLYADSTFFDVFPLPMIAGDRSSVLDHTSNAVVDRETAVRYFGHVDAIGETFSLNEKLFTVGAVMENLPTTTHFKAHIILPMSGVAHFYQDWVRTNISGRNMYTYIRTSQSPDPHLLESQINKLFGDQWPADKKPFLFLQPLTSIHLESSLLGEILPNGSKTDVRIFSITAIVILLLACINYINLAVAAALPRGKESGVKRVLGSTRNMIVAQFQTESFLILIISAVIAVVLAWLLIPFLNALSGKTLVLTLFTEPRLLLGLTTTIIVIGLIAGTIPALTLMGSGTIGMLSGNIDFKQRRFRPSNVLILFQFTIAVVLIASTVVIVQQIRYIRAKDIGVNMEHLIILPTQTIDVAAQHDLLRTELLKNSSISHVAGSTNNITGGVQGWRGYQLDTAREEVYLPTVSVTHDFFETMQASVVSGRTFSREFPSDKRSYVINETAARTLNLTNATGTQMFGAAFNGKTWNLMDGQIVGVVKDFHFSSLHSKVEPIVFTLSSDFTEPIAWMEIRINGENIQQAISDIEKTWSTVAGSIPIRYEFADDNLEQYYMAEKKFMKLFISFSGLAILLGALGLFGLTAFMARRRTKEIGIRKVIGASVSGLVMLLSRNFIVLVLVANLIGGPLAWYLMKRWLENFAFQTGISPWIFGGTAVIAVLIALAAILFHALKASNANPVKALRSE